MSWLPRAPTIKASSCFPHLNKMSHASLSQSAIHPCDLVGDEGAVEASSCRP